MKNIALKKPLILLFMSAMLMGCSSRTSIKPKQALQILDMIVFERNKEGFSRGNEISFIQKEIEGDASSTICFYELSEKNNVIHAYDVDDAALQSETWYYLESGILYNSYRGVDGNIFTIALEDDPEIADDSFSQFFKDFKVVANRKINEIDKPNELKDFIISLEDIDEQKLKTRYQTKKDYNLKADINIFDDIRKTNQLVMMKFEFEDSKLLSYRYQEKNEKISEYTINYTNSISRESIG